MRGEKVHRRDLGLSSALMGSSRSRSLLCSCGRSWSLRMWRCTSSRRRIERSCSHRWLFGLQHLNIKEAERAPVHLVPGPLTLRFFGIDRTSSTRAPLNSFRHIGIRRGGRRCRRRLLLLLLNLGIDTRLGSLPHVRNRGSFFAWSDTVAREGSFVVCLLCEQLLLPLLCISKR